MPGPVVTVACSYVYSLLLAQVRAPASLLLGSGMGSLMFRSDSEPERGSHVSI